MQISCMIRAMRSLRGSNKQIQYVYHYRCASSALSILVVGLPDVRHGALFTATAVTKERLAFARTLMKKRGGCSRQAGAAFTS